MSQAITTVYLPPTNTKGARIKAVCDAKTIIRPYTYNAHGVNEEHDAVAMELAKLMDWPGVYVRGTACPTNSRGNVYTRVPTSVLLKDSEPVLMTRGFVVI